MGAHNYLSTDVILVPRSCDSFRVTDGAGLGTRLGCVYWIILGVATVCSCYRERRKSSPLTLTLIPSPSLLQEAHVNSCYKHFYYFVCEFSLVDPKEFEPLVS